MILIYLTHCYPRKNNMALLMKKKVGHRYHGRDCMVVDYIYMCIIAIKVPINIKVVSTIFWR